jgi:hypothetical protein
VVLQIRRGTAADVASESFVPAVGEPLWLTDEENLYIGDGATQGGNLVGGASDLQELTSVRLISESTSTIDSFSIATNVATIDTTLSHDYYVGLQVTIAGATETDLNGTHTILSIPTASQFTFSLTHADVASTADSGTITPVLPDNNVLAWDAGNTRWEDKNPQSLVVTDVLYTKFQFNLAAAPTAAVASSQRLGRQAAIGTFSEVTNANAGTNGVGPGSTLFDPTLTGITETAGVFSGFTAGVYRIDVSLDIVIANLAADSYFNFNHTIAPENNGTALPGISQDFNFTTNGTAPAGNTSQTVNMSLIVHMENATAANNTVRINLDQDQSNDYYCDGATIQFSRLTTD